MKNQGQKSNIKTLIVFIAVSALIITGLVWYFVTQSNAMKNNSTTANETKKVAKKKDPEPVKEEVKEEEPVAVAPLETQKKPASTVVVTIPGAQPIEALVDNYDDDASIWHRVNKTHPFNTVTYAPSVQIVTVPTQSGRGADERSMRSIAIGPLQSMFDAARANGISLLAGSGYRSYYTQVALFNRYVSEVGRDQAMTFSAPPGHSEHQSGLTMDISSADMGCWLEICFGDTASGKWLAANSYRYGFILRYPQGKESITGFQYEPWHFRYVGIPLATALYQSGLTLDEAQPYINNALSQLREQGKV